MAGHFRPTSNLGVRLLRAAGSSQPCELITDDEVPKRALVGVDTVHLCCSNLVGDRAQVETDFVCDRESFTRYEFASGNLGSHLRWIIVPRLLAQLPYCDRQTSAESIG
jgi:hypothetical protein